MAKSKKKIGKIIIPGDANVWPHEKVTAKSLALAGHDVEFIKAVNQENIATADVLLDGEKWEIKSPTGAKLSLVEKNLRRGSKQSDGIIFDSRRVKHLPDKAIARELSTQLKFINNVKRIKFVNRHGKVLDIK
jgi:hypothetical protein